MLSARFRFRHVEQVRFRDLDSLGHVNNAVFLTYFESARIAYWLHATRRQGLGALDMILARAEVDYRSPLGYGESVEISVGCTSMGRSSFVLEGDMHERGSGRLVSESRKVLVRAGRLHCRTSCAARSWNRIRRRGRPRGPAAPAGSLLLEGEDDPLAGHAAEAEGQGAGRDGHHFAGDDT